LFRTGLQRETASAYALIPRLLTAGCAKYPTRRQLNAYLDKLGGARLIAEPVKKGEEQIISFYLTAPQGYTGKLFELLNDIVYSPLISGNAFMPEYMHSSFGAAARDIASKANDRRSYALERLFENMCGNEPFGISADGYTKDLTDISGERLYSAYLDLLQGGKRELYIVGDISREEAESYVTSQLKPANTAAELPTPDYRAERHETVIVTEKSKAVQSAVAIGIRTNSKDYARLLLANEILGGSSSSRLFNGVREKRGLCYRIGSRLYRYKGIIAVETGTDVCNIDEVLGCIEAEIRDITKRGVGARELKTAKQSLTTALRAIPDYPARLADLMLSLSVAGESSSIDDITASINAVEDLSGIFDNAFIDTVFILEGGNDI
jgi:predicted Zn-dependent peptidase